MFTYWWKLVLVGVYCQKWYVLTNTKRYGLVHHCSQLIESYVQMFKRFLRTRGNGNIGVLRKMFDFADLYCVAAAAFDEDSFYNMCQKQI